LAAAANLTRLDGRLRRWELVDTVLEMEADARLFALGEHYHAAGAARNHVDRHVERVIRSVGRPVLVVNGGELSEPQCLAIAFDGSPTASKMVEAVARSPLLTGHRLLEAMAGR
jgi:hypothetical protein